MNISFITYRLFKKIYSTCFDKFMILFFVVCDPYNRALRQYTTTSDTPIPRHSALQPHPKAPHIDLSTRVSGTDQGRPLCITTISKTPKELLLSMTKIKQTDKGPTPCTTKVNRIGEKMHR